MESLNMNRSYIVEAPRVNDSKMPTQLTKNGVWGLQDVPAQKLQTKQNLVV